MRWIGSRFWVGIVTAAVIALLGAAVVPTPLGHALENTAGLEWLFRLRGARPPPDAVLVVGLDQSSAQRLGLPLAIRDWPRRHLARLVDLLSARGASVIVLDLILEEATTPEDDRRLAEAIAASRRTILFQRTERADLPVGDAALGGAVTMTRTLGPLPAFATAARAVGPFLLPLTEGEVSRFWTFRTEGAERPTLPALALRLHALQQAAGSAPEPAPSAADPEGSAREDQALVELIAAEREQARRSPAAPSGAPAASPLDAAVAALYEEPDTRIFNFYGPARTIRTVSFATVIEAPETLPDLAGRVVFVGRSEALPTDVEDSFRTVMSGGDAPDLSGVELAATAFANLLEDNTLRPLEPRPQAALLLALGAAFGAIAIALPPLPAAAASLALLAGYAALAQAAFQREALWLAVATPALLQLPAALLIGLVHQGVGSRRRRQSMERAIRYYLPESAAARLADRRADPSAHHEIVYGVCLATDAQNFTTLAERLPAAEIRALLNAYFTPFFAAVDRHGGTVSTIVGDGAMCLWSAAEPSPGPRCRAAHAALDIAAAVDRFNLAHPDRQIPTRIGLHAGWASLGAIGGSGHFAYGVLGDVPNTASRIESLNKQLGTRRLASEAAVEGCDDVLLRRLGRFRLVGKAEALTIYELVAMREAAGADADALCGRYAEALAAYEDGQWERACRLFEGVLALAPDDGPTRLFLDRCRRFHSAPPDVAEPSIIVLTTK